VTEKRGKTESEDSNEQNYQMLVADVTAAFAFNFEGKEDKNMK